jgi:hypothetical protein
MQERGENRDFLRIEDTSVAEVLIDLHKQKFLAPFFGRELTVSEAAKRADVSHLLMFRHVKRFEILGLLKKTRTEPRRGSAIHYYQTTANEFFIPAKVLPFEVVLEVVEHSIQQTFLRGVSQTLLKHDVIADLGTRIYPEDAAMGGVGVAPQLALKPGEGWNPSELEHAALLDSWVTLKVSLEDAKKLQKELEEIAERYHLKGGSETYLLRLGLTPVE